MHKLSSRWWWAILLILAVFGVAGCEQTRNLLTPTSTPGPEPAATATATPTATPELTEGLYPPILVGYEPPHGQEVAPFIAVDATTAATDQAFAIRLYFDQPMDQASVVAAFRVTPPLQGEFEWLDDATLAFYPETLAEATRYRVTLAGDVRSTTGLSLSTDLSFAFSTLSPLKVTRLEPASGAFDARIDAPILIAFNHAVVPLSCIGQSAQANGKCRLLSLTFTPPVLGAGTWVDASVYRFDSIRGWAAGQAYTATLATGVASLEGAVLRDPVSWSFSTAAPRIETTIPASGQSQTLPETDIRVIFNTPMDQEITGSVFSVAGEGGEVVPGVITWEDNGAILVFTPLSWLDLESRYTVRVGARARAATSAPLENPQSWTFTTVPYPALVSSIPEDGATDVDTATPLRLVFSGALDAATLDRNITITPTVEKPYAYFDAATNVYHLAWDKQPRTAYCVLLEPGIVDVYGNGIENSYDATLPETCFVTGDLPSSVVPSNMGRAVILDAAEPAELYFLVQNLDRASFTLSEASKLDFLRGREVQGVPIRAWQETFTAPRNTATVAPLVLPRLGGALPTGYYHLAWENPPWGLQSLSIAVVDRHVTLKLAEKEALVWVTDLRSAEPISRTAVRLVDREGVLIAAGTTDADGLADIPFTPREDLWEHVAAIVGEPGEVGFGVALSSWTGRAAPPAFGIALDGGATQPFVIRVYTDRTVYGPAEAVHFWGILRKGAERYTLPSPDMPVQVLLRDAAERGFYTTTVTLSDTGVFTGALVLPENAPVGEYRLEVSLPGVAHHRPGIVPLVIAPRRETTLAVSVAPESADVISGDTVRATVIVDDVSTGVPLAATRLTWAVYAQSEPLSALPAEMWQWPETALEERVLHAEGEAVTDAEGRFVLELPVVIPADAAAPSLDRQRWIIEATVYDTRAHASPVSGWGYVLVHPSRFYLGMRPREWVARAGTRTEINLLALDWEQRPVAEQETTVSLAQRVWFGAPGAPGAVLPASGYTDTVISTISVRTDLEGKAVAPFTPPRSGAYVVAAEALDEGGFPVRTEVLLWVSGPEAASWPQEVGKVTPVSDARVYQVGDRARILLPVGFKGPYQMLMTVERNGIFEVERRQLDLPNPVVEIPIVEAYVPNVYVSFVLIRGITETVPAPELRVGYVRLDVAPSAQTLAVSAKSDRAVYQPGDTVTLTVSVENAAGQPVAAEVGVALVDKALLSRETTIPSIVEAFYGERPLRVMTGGGLLVSSRRQEAALPAEVAAYLRAGHTSMDTGEASVSSGGFAGTALWKGYAQTGEDGELRLSFVLPDTHATWVAAVYAFTGDTKVGETRVEINAVKPLHIRPVMPPFLVVGDETEIAAVVYNRTNAPIEVTAQLAASMAARVDPLTQTLALPAAGHARVAWTLSVAQSSAETLALEFSATAREHQDAVSVELPLHRYVMPDVMGVAGVLDATGTRKEALLIPTEAGDASALIVRVASSPAGALVDTLAYLDQYPYASTDVLIERFVSSVFTYYALQALGTDDAVEIGRPILMSRLRASIVQAMQPLYARQNADGGWGWWEGRSTLHLTAFATMGLNRAERAGIKVSQTVRERALNYIYDDLAQALSGPVLDPHHALALYVLSDAHVAWPTGAGAALYAVRESLGTVGRAYLALALGTIDPSDSRLVALLGGLRSEAKLSTAGAHWEGAGEIMVGNGVHANGGGLHWYTDVVVTSIVVDALARFTPNDPLLAQATRWLMVTRRGGRWQTTYETAWAIVALSDALCASGDLLTARGLQRYDWSVALNGSTLTAFTAQPGERAGLIAIPWRLRAGLSGDDPPTGTGEDGALRPILFRDRPNVLEISRGSGAGLLYYTAHVELTAPVAEIAAESRGLVLRRDYCAVDEGMAVYGGAVAPACRPVTELRVGDHVEERLTLIVPQPRAYVRLEAPVPVGLIPLGVTGAPSGAMTGCALPESAHMSFPASWTAPFERCEVLAGGRDSARVVFYASEVAAGTYQMSYVLRAVIPGAYGVLPAVVSQVYFPEVWGRSAGDVIRIAPQTQD